MIQFFISFSILIIYLVYNPQILVLDNGTWEFYGHYNSLSTHPVRWTMEDGQAVVHVLFVSLLFLFLFNYSTDLNIE